MEKFNEIDPKYNDLKSKIDSSIQNIELELEQLDKLLKDKMKNDKNN